MIWQIIIGVIVAGILFRLIRVFIKASQATVSEALEFNNIVCAYGDPAVASALDAFKPEPKILALMKAADPKDYSARYFYCQAIVEDVDLDTMAKLRKKSPDDADVQLLYALALMERGFTARTTERASDVSEEQWEKTYHYLEQASEEFHKAAELRPDDPTPWGYQLLMSKVLGDDQEQRFAWLNAATEREADNWQAHMAMISALSKRWGGSHEAMFDFARRVVENAEDGSDLPIILLRANEFYMSHLHSFDYDEAAAERFAGDPEVHAESLAAWQKSLAHPNHIERKTTVFARHIASAWFWNSRQKAPLKAELAHIEAHLQDIHWRDYFAEGELQQAKAFAAEKNPFAAD